MLKTACCCFCIRRKSKVTVAPHSTVPLGEQKSGRVLVQTAPGRFISVLVLTNNGDPSSAPISTTRRHRIQRSVSVATEHKDMESKVSGDQESDTEQDKAQTVVVIVDVERPKTSDTISSRISLPPLGSASPVVTTGKIKRVKWNLRRRRNSEPKTEVLPKSVSASSITTTLCGQLENEDGQSGKEKESKESAHTSQYQYQDVWQDEIITLPGTAEAEGQVEVGEREDGQRGIGNGVVLFFIHGVGGNGSIWVNQIKYFRQLGYTIICIDLIGHGNSSVLKAKSAYTFESIKSDMLALFDRFARDKNVVIAHSYGTCFAAVLGRERRDRVSHLVLISSGAPVPLDANDGAFALPTPVLALLRPALSRTFMKLAFVSTPSADVFRSSFGSVKTGVLKRIMQGQRWSECNYLYHQQIHSPTLLIYGSGDGLVSLDEMHEMRKAIPGSVLEVVDQAAHMVMLEQPASVNRLIEEFLRKTAAAEEAAEEEGVEEAEIEQGYRENRNRQRPTTATSRTIPPASVFKIHGHDTNINITTRTVAVS